VETKSPSIPPSSMFQQAKDTWCSFSINPVYRGETRGTYSMVLNTILTSTASTLS